MWLWLEWILSKWTMYDFDAKCRLFMFFFFTKGAEPGITHKRSKIRISIPPTTSVESYCKTFSHVWIHLIIRDVGYKQPYDAEDKCKDQGADWQDELAGHLHHALHSLGILLFITLLFRRLLFSLFLVLSRLDSDDAHSLVRTNIACSWLLEHLIGCVQDHLKEGHGHREEHPDVDHLDVRRYCHCLRESEETVNEGVSLAERNTLGIELTWWTGPEGW